MSDISNPSRRPDPTSVICPECSAKPGYTCAIPPDFWNHESRIWVAQSIMRIEELKMRKPIVSGEVDLAYTYESGWNNALESALEHLRKIG